jgi:hypothetical protein
LVRIASIVGASVLTSTIVVAAGSTTLTSTIVVAAGSTTLTSSVATLLLSSVGLVAWVASVGESTWVCCGGNDGWDARAADIVGDHVGLGRKGSSCYGVENAFISAIDEAEEE